MIKIIEKYSRMIKYIICVSISVILIVIAIIGPQLLLTVQDNYHMGKSWQGKRVGLDMEALNNSYGSLRDRLTAFATGVAQDKDYYVTGTDYQVTEEFYDIIEQLFEQELVILFMNMCVSPYYSPELIEKGYDIIECKKYFVYDASFDEGVTSVVAMAWYIELEIADKQRIKILVDTEKNTVYYMEYASEENDESDKTESYKKGLLSKSKGMFTDVFYYMYPISYAYYEAGQEKTLTEWEALDNYNDAVDFYGENWSYGDMEAYVQVAIPYGNNGNCLTWEMGVYFKNEKMQNGTLYLGIREIKELIPEFQ